MELLRRGFKKFDLDYLNVPEQLKKRGVDDPNMVSACSLKLILAVTFRSKSTDIEKMASSTGL